MALNPLELKLPNELDVLDAFLACRDPKIRNRTLRLLLFSSATTSKISGGTLAYIKRNIKFAFHDGDAHSRSELLGIIRSLLARLTDSASAAKKLHYTDGVCIDYSDFIFWFLDFLQEELSPTASYNRRVIGLSALKLIFEVIPNEIIAPGRSQSADKFWAQQNLAEMLLALLFDPFEDVRQMSLNVLEILQGQNEKDILPNINFHIIKHPHTIQWAEEMAARSGRADHADGLANLYALTARADIFENLASRLLAVLSEDISIHHSTFPIHGGLLGLANGIRKGIIPQADEDKLVRLCSKVWSRVQNQLCVDSPEFASSEDLDQEGIQGPKDLLAYSWRALRDSRLVCLSFGKYLLTDNSASLLMLSMLENWIATFKLYAAIGELCMQQLTMLRHRGAFSTVAQTFAACCQRAQACAYPQVLRLTRDWYKVI